MESLPLCSPLQQALHFANTHYLMMNIHVQTWMFITRHKCSDDWPLRAHSKQQGSEKMWLKLSHLPPEHDLTYRLCVCLEQSGSWAYHRISYTVPAVGGRITGFLLREPQSQLGSCVFLKWLCARWVGVLSGGLLCSGGAVVPHWCLYGVNTSFLSEDSTLRSLRLSSALFFALCVHPPGVSAQFRPVEFRTNLCFYRFEASKYKETLIIFMWPHEGSPGRDI